MARYPDLIGLVSLEAVHGVAILVREHRHRLGTQFECCAHRSNGDLTAVGYENLREHPVLSYVRQA